MGTKQNKAVQNHKNNKQAYKHQKKFDMIIWGTIVVAIVIFALAIILKPEPAPVAVPYEKLPVLGDPNSDIKIVEIGDYKCPACQLFSQLILPELKADFVDTGLAAIYFMNYPFLGPDSETAALAAEAVHQQSNDAFWIYNDAIYKNQQDENTLWATKEYLLEIAKQSGIDVDLEKLEKDIEDRTYQNVINEQLAFMQENKVTGTPTLFINGVELENVFDYDALKKEIEQFIAKQQSGGK